MAEEKSKYHKIEELRRSRIIAHARMSLTTAFSHFSHDLQLSRRGNRWPQQYSLTGPTRDSPGVMVFILYLQAVDWSPWPNFQSLPGSGSSVYRGHRSSGMCNTCPNHPNPFNSCASRTSELLWKSSHHIQAVLRWHWSSNADSLRTSSYRNGCVPKPYSRTDLTGTVRTRLWSITGFHADATDVSNW